MNDNPSQVVKETTDNVWKKLLDILNIPFQILSYIFTTMGKITNVNYNSPTVFILFKYGFIFACIVCLILFFVFTNEYSYYTSENIYTLLYPLLVLLVFIIGLLLTSKFSYNKLYNIYSIIFGLIILSLCIYIYTSNNYYENVMINAFSGVLMFLLIILCLAILFYFTGHHFKRMGGSGGFIYHMISYFPCLLLQFIEYLKKEFNDTTNDVFYLFLLMILCILAYLFVPKILNHTTTRNAVVLQPKSSFLNNEYVVASSDIWEQKTTGQLKYNQHFSLSFWVYLNDQPMNNHAYSKETTILDFSEGAPKVTYEYKKNENDDKDRLNIYLTNHEEYYNESITLPIKKQKWNNLVFNYNSEYTDVFLNGNLVRSLNLANKPPQFTSNQFLVTGANNGLDGAISNILYYPYPLTRTEIVTQYNVYSIHNPPEYIE